MSRAGLALRRLDLRLASFTTGRFYVAITIVLFIAFVLRLAYTDQLYGPPAHTGGDEPDYDNIACSLRATGSFAADYQSPLFLAPYRHAIEAGRSTPGYPERVAEWPAGLTTCRPPLLPALLAWTYGSDLPARRFHVIRWTHALAAAATVGVASWLCRSAAGPIASFACLGLMCCYGRMARYTGDLMTESLAGLFTTCALAVMVSLTPKRPILAGLVTGFIWAAAVLTRSSAILWAPAIGAGLWFIARRPQRGLPPACFLAVLLLALLPWSIRNCRVLGTFMPLGCQGYLELPTGISDEAMDNWGVWFPLPTSTAPPEGRPLPELERSAAEEGRAKAVAWISDHPGKLPILTLRKLWSEWKPRRPAAALVLFLAVIGGCYYRRSAFGWGCLSILMGDVIMVAATWSVEGRFTYPAIGALYALAGAGAWSVLRLAMDFRSRDIAGGSVSSEPAAAADAPRKGG